VKIAFLNKYQNKVNRGAEVFITEVSNRLTSQFEVDVISDINYLKILNKKYDVIVPTNGRFQVFIIRIISWLSGARMVVSGQSGIGADDKWNLLCLPNRFVALTEFQKNWAKKFNPLIKVVKIPNGVDLEEYKNKNSKIKTDLPKPIILSVGALEDGKRLDLIIKAVAKINASLLLVGKGSKEKELTELGNELLPGRFKIMSFTHEEMPKVYASCDLFTYPTVPWESFGIALVEAMASGLGVVATDDPIRKEIVWGAGIFADPKDTEKYAEALHKALHVKWGIRPRKQSQQFDWDDIAKKYAELFRSL
jgi:glycosyltransferase involved in cell wall biosynthesis